jgi:disease resistance protein RPS2
MDLAGAVVGEVYRDGRNYFNSRINYAKNLENNHIRLKEVAKNLSAKMKDMENAANRDRTKELSEECKCWIDRVKESEEEVQVLETDYEKIKNQNRNLLSKSFSRNRAKVSKRMEKKLTELLELYSEGTIRLDEKPPERVIRIGAPKIEGKSSLHLAVKEILGHLRTPDIKRVGLWGIMGVGKTAIMQNMNNNADVAKMFDIVIWLTVSKYLGIEKLLRAITQRLKLNVEDITEPDEIAQRIRTELEHKKYLLLLDEVGKAFDLGDIGISCNQNDSKVVLATRYFHICNDMMTDAEVQVQRLSEKDAYEMFWEKVGQNVSLSGTVEPKSRQVVKECSGLPLLIEKIAPSFRRYGENLDLWEDGLRRLQEQPTTISKSIDEVIGFLEFCYNQLGDEVKKFCFLYGALYPEDCEIYIDHLLECWKAEDFIHDEGFRFARITGWGILNDLILSSLLEMSEKMNHVRMNKVVRRMARKISNVESREANRISLRNDKLCTLPEMPSWRMKLLTLFLHRNLSFEVIPESFFELMKNLQVLDLHRTGITSLPSSISSLTSLKALYLNSCNNLEELPTGIKNLIHLEILDIRDTKINVIPIEIQGLTKLKCLRLSLSDVGMGQSSNAEFGKDVLSKLSLLEELRINVDEKGFPQLGTFMYDISRGVASLEKLTSLSICFPGVDYLEEFISNFHLWRDEHFKFQFSVGSHDQTRYKIFDNSKKLTSLSICFPEVDFLGTFISIFPLWKVPEFKF